MKKRTSKMLSLVALLCAASLLLCACGSAAPAATTAAAVDSPNSAQSLPAEKQTVRIGFCAPIAAGAYMYEMMMDAIEVGQKHVIEDGLLSGYDIEIVPMDDNMTVDGSITAVNNLIYEEKVQAIIGHAMTLQNLATGPICEEEHIPLIFYGGGSAPTLQGWEYTLRNSIEDMSSIRALCAYLVEDRGLKNIAIFYVNTDAGTIGLECGSQFLQEQYGLDWCSTQQFSAEDRDFSGSLLAVRDTDPDAIIVFGGDATNASIIYDQKNQLIGEDVYFAGGLSFAQQTMIDSMGYEKLDDVAFVSTWVPTDSEKDTRFINYFMEINKNHEAPIEICARMYDTMYILAAALENMNNYSVDAEDFSEKLCEALHHVEIDGLQGHLKYNETGDPLEQSVIALYHYNKETDSLTIERVR